RRAGNTRSVQLLLERGANPTERNDAGVSPLLAGAASGDLETVRLLLGAGAKANDFPKSNQPRTTDMAAGFRTPLMWAAYHNDVRMVRLLLERGADPNQATYFGNPLSHACWSDSFEAAEVLLAHGAKVNARDAVANFTPLHWAAGTRSPPPPFVKAPAATGAGPEGGGGGPRGAFGPGAEAPGADRRKTGRAGICQCPRGRGCQSPAAVAGQKNRHAAAATAQSS